MSPVTRLKKTVRCLSPIFALTKRCREFKNNFEFLVQRSNCMITLVVESLNDCGRRILHGCKIVVVVN